MELFTMCAIVDLIYVNFCELYQPELEEKELCFSQSMNRKSVFWADVINIVYWILLLFPPGKMGFNNYFCFERDQLKMDIKIIHDTVSANSTEMILVFN